VNIHQMQMRFDPAADRLLWQLRTFGGEMFGVWLTRRLLRHLWPPMQDLVTQSGIAQLMPHATVLPEARAMLAQAARERPLPTAQFDQPFTQLATARPLGTEPLLPGGFKLSAGPKNSGLTLEMQEDGGRSLKLQLSDDLSAALVRLIEQALAEADWNLAPAHAPDAPDAAESGRPSRLS
jgi:hypothetical protein